MEGLAVLAYLAVIVWRRDKTSESVKEIQRRSAAKSYLLNPEKWKARTKRWYAANKERAAAYHKAYREKKREEKRSYFRDYYEKNAERLKARARINGSVWRKANLDKARARSMRHTAAKLRAMPIWADHRAIDAVYEECVRVALDTGEEHHVDHMVPLQGKQVCGLHVHHNLQILPGRENQSKGARYWPDMP